MEHLYKNNQIDLSDFFITKSQASDFSLRLSNILDKMFENDFNLEKALIEEFGIEKKDKFIMQLHENKLSTNINDFLKTLPEIVAKIPIITITIAFEPSQETLQSISQWFLINLKTQYILDLQIDRKIIGGAVINFNGKYKDYSIKPLFNEIIKQNLNNPSQKTPTLHQNTEYMTIGR